jgi:hypothetical protein
VPARRRTFRRRVVNRDALRVGQGDDGTAVAKPEASSRVPLDRSPGACARTSGPSSSGGRIGNSEGEGVLRLSRAESRLPDDDRLLTLDDRGVVGGYREWLGVLKLVEALMARAPGSDAEPVRPSGLPVGEEDRDPDLGTSSSPQFRMLAVSCDNISGWGPLLQGGMGGSSETTSETQPDSFGAVHNNARRSLSLRGAGTLEGAGK